MDSKKYTSDFFMSEEVFKVKYETARQIAEKAHAGQKDWFEIDYIKHPIAVSESCSSPYGKIAALLHDTVEDTYVTLDDLRVAGFDDRIIEAVDCLTKRKGEALEAYYSRVAKSDIALEVKFADMRHNSDMTRFPAEQKEQARANNKKYLSRARILSEMIGEKRTKELVSAETYDWLIGVYDYCCQCPECLTKNILDTDDPSWIVMREHIFCKLVLIDDKPRWIAESFTHNHDKRPPDWCPFRR